MIVSIYQFIWLFDDILDKYFWAHIIICRYRTAETKFLQARLWCPHQKHFVLILDHDTRLRFRLPRSPLVFLQRVQSSSAPQMVGCFKPPTLWMNRRCFSCTSLPCNGRTCWGPINPCQVGTAEKKSWWSLKTLKTFKLHRIAKWSERFFFWVSVGFFLLSLTRIISYGVRDVDLCAICAVDILRIHSTPI